MTGEKIEFGGSGGSWGPSGLVGGCVGDVSDCIRTGLDNLRRSGAACGRTEASWRHLVRLSGNTKTRL
eukprot:8684097-Pyramimonas_sp.AAC.1